MYTTTVHLRNGVPVDVPTKELPSLSEHNLLHFEKPNGDMVTFVVDAVAYFTTRTGV